MFKQYQAIIFDMDGTLVDSGKAHEIAWSQTLERYSLPVDRPLMRSLAGVSTRSTVEFLIKHFNSGVSANLEEICAFKESVVHDNFEQYVKPTDLYHVAKQYYGEMPMSVGTGDTTESATRILGLCGLSNWMECIVGADQVVNPKPAPDTFLRCAELMEVPPQACVVLEDSKLGIQAAQAAGMAVIDVTDVFGITGEYFL